jgi:hypothetical protein
MRSWRRAAKLTVYGFPMTFSAEARLASQQNNKKASFRCSFWPESGEDVIDTSILSESDDRMTKKGLKRAPEMPRTCFSMIDA